MRRAAPLGLTASHRDASVAALPQHDEARLLHASRLQPRTRRARSNSRNGAFPTCASVASTLPSCGGFASSRAAPPYAVPIARYRSPECNVEAHPRSGKTSGRQRSALHRRALHVRVVRKVDGAFVETDAAEHPERVLGERAIARTGRREHAEAEAFFAALDQPRELARGVIRRHAIDEQAHVHRERVLRLRRQRVVLFGGRLPPARGRKSRSWTRGRARNRLRPSPPAIPTRARAR